MNARLFDTNILLWAVDDSPRLSREAARLVDDASWERWFSSLTIAEVAIKSAKKQPGFDVQPVALRGCLLERGS